MKQISIAALSVFAIGCSQLPTPDAGTDGGTDGGAPYEVLDGGLYKFLDERARSCDDACAELGLDCSGAFWNGSVVPGVYDYGECRRIIDCHVDGSSAGLCYSDQPLYPMHWMACGCRPFHDAGP